jgi:predicted nucleic acid-binding protein
LPPGLLEHLFSVIVVDASVLAPALINDDDEGDRARARLAGERLAAPAVIDLEVASAWRRIARSGRLAEGRADQARAHLAALARAPGIACEVEVIS